MQDKDKDQRQYEPDAFGHVLMDYMEEGQEFNAVERDDGYIAPSLNPELYFAPFARWEVRQQQAMGFVRGRVLDVGAGAGRHTLYLQEQGHEVVAIDVSPLAVDVCRKRGVKDIRQLSLFDVDESIGQIDTVIMMGNNFGVFGNPDKTRTTLERLSNLMPDDGRIVAETLNPYGTDRAVHLAYHERNRQQGRLSGQVWFRTRYLQYADDWFEYLFVSPDEMRDIIAGTGWQVSQTLGDENNIYIAIIDKVP